MTVIFCGFISHLIGRETINIPEIFPGVHGFTGKTVKVQKNRPTKIARQRDRTTRMWLTGLKDGVLIHRYVSRGMSLNNKVELNRNNTENDNDATAFLSLFQKEEKEKDVDLIDLTMSFDQLSSAENTPTKTGQNHRPSNAKAKDLFNDKSR